MLEHVNNTFLKAVSGFSVAIYRKYRKFKPLEKHIHLQHYSFKDKAREYLFVRWRSCQHD